MARETGRDNKAQAQARAVPGPARAPAVTYVGQLHALRRVLDRLHAEGIRVREEARRARQEAAVSRERAAVEREESARGLKLLDEGLERSPLLGRPGRRSR